jgi:hypothetical protein
MGLEMSSRTAIRIGGWSLIAAAIGGRQDVARSNQGKRWFSYPGIAVGVIGCITAFRNVTPLVGPVAEVNNYLLPLWLIVGVTLARWRPT